MDKSSLVEKKKLLSFSTYHPWNYALAQLLEFIPLAVFFLVYKFVDIYAAVAALMAVMGLALIITKIRGKENTNMQWISFILVLVFGGATLFLHNELFLKWKPTILNWLFAIVFLGSQFFGPKTIVERMLAAGHFELPRNMWLRLNFSWVVFFLILGALNLLVAYQFSTDVWVNFKVFGMLGLSILFVVIQGIFITRFKNNMNNINLVKKPEEL